MKIKGFTMLNTCCYCSKTFLKDQEPWYGLHQDCFRKWFAINEICKFGDVAPRSLSLAPEEKNISFFSGAYRKYSAKLEDQNYILKVQQKEYPELPATEFLCNQIFESLHITIPDYYLVLFPEHELCFVTKNFMSGLTSCSLVHIYHILQKGMEHNCENLMKVIIEHTKRKTEIEKFICLTLADSLIGNHDRHGRNLAFIQSPQGMRLAPFYDNPSSIALEEKSMLKADLQPRGSIFTKESDKPTIKDYVKEWKRLGYGEIVDHFRKKISLENIEILIKKSYLGDERKQALLCLIKKRYEELCVNIK